MRKLLQTVGMTQKIEVDSAGTQNYHVGEAPDFRSQAHACRRGYDLSALRARQIASQDFQHFDLILAMDRSHFTFLQRICPAEHRPKLRLFLEFAHDTSEKEVPDPYYGGEEGFERTLNLIEAGCHGLLAMLRSQVETAQTIELEG